MPIGQVFRTIIIFHSLAIEFPIFIVLFELFGSLAQCGCGISVKGRLALDDSNRVERLHIIKTDTHTELNGDKSLFRFIFVIAGNVCLAND